MYNYFMKRSKNRTTATLQAFLKEREKAIGAVEETVDRGNITELPYSTRKRIKQAKDAGYKFKIR